MVQYWDGERLDPQGIYTKNLRLLCDNFGTDRDSGS